MPKCMRCKTEFAETSNGRAGRPRVFCSEECGRAQRLAGAPSDVNSPKKLRKFQCVECGGEWSKFTRGKSRLRFCSNRCSENCAKSGEQALRKMVDDSGSDRPIGLYELWVRDGGVCHICGEPVLWEKYKQRHRDSPSRDHVVPVSKGGRHTHDNIKLAHLGCNGIKQDSDTTTHTSTITITSDSTCIDVQMRLFD